MDYNKAIQIMKSTLERALAVQSEAEQSDNQAAVAAAKEAVSAMELAVTAMLKLSEQKNSDSDSHWIPVEERLPHSARPYQEYNVIVEQTHWPTTPFDIVDSPFTETYSTTAQYDSGQKIWRLFDGGVLNALIMPGDCIDGMCVTHWAELPKWPVAKAQVDYGK